MSLEVNFATFKARLRYNSRNGSELMVESVYRHVQHHALIKDDSQISKISLILYHSYCENLTWFRKGNVQCMYVVAAILDGFKRNRKGALISNNFFKLYFIQI